MKNSKKAAHNYILDHRQIFDVLDLLSLFISIYISNVLLYNAVYGATLFICGFAFQKYLFLKKHKTEPIARTVLFILLSVVVMLMLGFTVLLFIIYPSLNGNAHSYVTGIFIVLLFIRSSTTVAFIKKYPEKNHIRTKWIMLSHLCIFTIQYVMLGFFVSWNFAFKICFLSLTYTIAVLIWLYCNRNGKFIFIADYSLSRVSSYKVYGAMLLCSNVSLYLSIMNYISILTVLPKEDLYFFPLALWLILIFICVLLLGRFIKRGALKSLEKNSLFLTGGFLWILSYLQLNEGFFPHNSSFAWLWSFFQAVGLAFMVLLSTYTQEDMKLVLELTDDTGDTAVKTNRTIIQQTAFLIAGIIIYFELVLINFGLEGRFSQLEEIGGFQKIYISVLDFVPIGFVLLSMFFSLIQPVNRDIVRKLKLFRDQKLLNTVNPAFKDKLEKILLKKYRIRIGVKILAFFIKPLLYHKVINSKSVDQSGGPVVFIVNHREIYGPIIANLYLPFSFRPWIEHNMLERNSIANHIWEGSFKSIKPGWLAKLLLNLIVPLVLWILNSVEPIPIYRKTREVLKTIDLTVEALMEQDNILIFPENPLTTDSKRYAVSGVSQFYTGFVYLAKSYYKKTGKQITFYPVYANPKKRTITFGEGVRYNPEEKNEPERISMLLIQAMNAMAK